MADKPQQQTQTFYFSWSRTLIGWVWVAKRMMFALTVGQLVEGSTIGAIVLLTIREGLSAITDYSTPADPINSVTQASPPNEPVEEVEEKA